LQIRLPLGISDEHRISSRALAVDDRSAIASRGARRLRMDERCGGLGGPKPEGWVDTRVGHPEHERRDGRMGSGIGPHGTWLRK
jgi:hypothetical protein